ncbi:hypothetical protein MP228_012226 [Amoeboaphelidium protococcarum]|nr:hypothetical protein MP228_012226 [Amoeboaphelidium protococcarum]
MEDINQVGMSEEQLLVVQEQKDMKSSMSSYSMLSTDLESDDVDLGVRSVTTGSRTHTPRSPRSIKSRSSSSAIAREHSDPQSISNALQRYGKKESGAGAASSSRASSECDFMYSTDDAESSHDSLEFQAIPLSQVTIPAGYSGGSLMSRRIGGKSVVVVGSNEESTRVRRKRKPGSTSGIQLRSHHIGDQDVRFSDSPLPSGGSRFGLSGIFFPNRQLNAITDGNNDNDEGETEDLWSMISAAWNGVEQRLKPALPYGNAFTVSVLLAFATGFCIDYFLLSNGQSAGGDASLPASSASSDVNISNDFVGKLSTTNYHFNELARIDMLPTDLAIAKAEVGLISANSFILIP